MVEYVTDYRGRGNAAMVVYDDLGSVHASDALDAMLRDSSFVFSVVPSLGRHLASYPRDTLAGAEEVLFWSLEDLPHVRRVLRITHQTVYEAPELPGTTVFAAKQIYADHYFEAGFDLTTVIDRQTTGATPGIYLVLLRRSRFDDLPTGLFNIRGKVIGKLRDQMRTDLERAKTTAEALGK